MRYSYSKYKGTETPNLKLTALMLLKIIKLLPNLLLRADSMTQVSITIFFSVIYATIIKAVWQIKYKIILTTVGVDLRDTGRLNSLRLFSPPPPKIPPEGREG
jgi:hypothetical protein